MSTPLPDFPKRRAGSFQQIVFTFLCGDGPAFARVLTADRIQRVFAKHSGFSGIYSTAMILWAFLDQVLRDGKGASCRAAVARICSYAQSGSPASYFDFGAEHFENLRSLWNRRPGFEDRNWREERDSCLRAMEAAMAKLDAAGLFGTGAARLNCMVNVEVVPPDHTNTQRAIRVIPAAAIERWLSEAAEPE